jgi:hypothetical protein
MDKVRLQRAVRNVIAMNPKGVSRLAVPALTMKRFGFMYENEVRIVVCSPAAEDSPTTATSKPDPHRTLKGVALDCIEKIQIDPYLPRWQGKELVNLFKQSLRVEAQVTQASSY